MKRLLSTTLSILLLTTNGLALAEYETDYTQPKMSRNGNWLTNAGPVSGKVTGRQATAGALWRVTTRRLSCRKQAATNSQLVTTFKLGNLVQANLFRGGSDEVLFNAKDRQGQTWMRVLSPEGRDLNCFVRAHRRYIQPLKQPIK